MPGVTTDDDDTLFRRIRPELRDAVLASFDHSKEAYEYLAASEAKDRARAAEVAALEEVAMELRMAVAYSIVRNGEATFTTKRSGREDEDQEAQTPKGDH